MQRKTPGRLWDAREAAILIRQFIAGKSFEDYGADPLFRSAVERQFTIVGEALNQLNKADEKVAESIPELREIVSFRNILVHGYAVVRDRTVWDVAVNELPGLIQRLDELLDVAGPPELGGHD